jgi:hypothetical protein
VIKGRYLKGKEGKTQTSIELVPCRGGQSSFMYRSTTFEQSRALGLCHKCNEKYFSDHKCNPQIVNVLEA